MNITKILYIFLVVAPYSNAYSLTRSSNFPFPKVITIKNDWRRNLDSVHGSPSLCHSSWMKRYASATAIQYQRGVLLWRTLVVAGAIAAWIKLPLINVHLDRLWQFLTQAGWFRNDMFEPLLSVGSFFIWIHGWLLLDIIVMNKNAPRGIQRLRNFRFQDQKAWSNRSAGNSNLTTKDIDGMIESDHLKPKTSEDRMSRWYRGWYWEMMVYLIPLWAIAKWTNIFAPRRRALMWTAPKLPLVVFQVFGGLFLYDFFFYFSHVILHKLPSSLYRALHGKHHENAEVRASDTVRLTVPEEAVDVMCSIAALRILRAHPISRAIYDMVITFLLVELHCGYDMPWSPQNLLPPVFAGSRRHHFHHRTGRKYYQKFFRYLDDLFCRFIH